MRFVAVFVAASVAVSSTFSADLGMVAVGMRADLVLLEADPSADIRNAQAVHAVIKGGQVVDRTTLRLPGNR